jgi:hypothetical protein
VKHHELRYTILSFVPRFVPREPNQRAIKHPELPDTFREVFLLIAQGISAFLNSTPQKLLTKSRFS